ncbi:hypothetical protein B0H21DRAFT_715369 [Amylocystis lapponica]|nr:hypothetical protein B0H21DRAFT_715369 [Amylocystis lapponica]
MLRLQSPRLLFRSFHTSPARCHLVGPSDPVSNLRPIIYDDAPPVPAELDARHPYSLTEFTGDTREYQWKMQRQELDAYNHAFWSDHNSRFEAAKSAVLESLPQTASVEDREFALSHFYKSWVAQEQVHHREYGAQWRRRNWTSILLGARLHYEKFMSRISHPFTPNNNS